MELIMAVRSRVSTGRVDTTSPDDAEFAKLAGVAAHAPDHAALRPWRLVLLRGDARAALGAAMARGFGDPEGSEAAAKTATKPLRAPLLVGIIGRPVAHPKVAQWEQLAAVGAYVATLELVLFDAGYTAMWRTGPAVDLAEVRQVMGVEASEQLLGWLYVGGTATGVEARGDADPDIGDRISVL